MIFEKVFYVLLTSLMTVFFVYSLLTFNNQRNLIKEYELRFKKQENSINVFIRDLHDLKNKDVDELLKSNGIVFK